MNGSPDASASERFARVPSVSMGCEGVSRALLGGHLAEKERTGAAFSRGERGVDRGKDRKWDNSIESPLDFSNQKRV